VSKGFLIFAEGDIYVKQAYALALSIKASQSAITSVSLITNNKVPKKYQKLFDQIIPIPWYEQTGTRFSAEHRWKLFHVTPYFETIVLDADMLFLDDISTWWEYCSHYDMRFCSRIKNYKLENVVDTFHRKAFIANNLTSPYCALHYFKKNDFSLNFYKVLEFVIKNWEWCWNKFAPLNYQDWVSMDLAVAVAIEIMCCHEEVLALSNPMEFVHMKIPLQGWPLLPDTWQNAVPYILNSKGELIVGNIKQPQVFHYVEKDFVTTNLLAKLEELANGK
jgi:hypothetical protein